MRRSLSGSSHHSIDSASSETPLNILLAEPVTDEQGTTFFLLDVNNQEEPPVTKKSKHHRNKKTSEGDDGSDSNNSSSSSSSSSSGSSVSAQVVIDHGGSIPRRLEKNGLGQLGDESESDYAFCYTPASRRGSDADSVSNSGRLLKPSHLHLMEPGTSQPEETDLSAAENDGDDDLEQEEVSNKPGSPTHKGRRRRHRHHKKAANRNGSSRKDLLADSKAMVTVYTEEDDDLVDEMPRGDRERMLRHNERNYRSRHEEEIGEGFRRRSIPRRLHKRTQRVLQTNLQSHSWSRRESLQSNRHHGLSSDEALR